MEILRTMLLYTEGRNMPFLVIGGHAVNAYGISRQTGDIDLLVQRCAKERWLELMSKLNYSVGQNDDRFTRFKPDSLAAWPIDLMYVDDSTFDKLLEQAVDMPLGAVQIKVASPRHLATLKIHALKHFQEHRFAKDYTDLVSLLQSGKTGLNSADLKDLCIKYASLDLYNRVINDLGATWP